MAKFPDSAASELSPLGVARISRLIGNFDTTANAPGLQVERRGLLAALFAAGTEAGAFGSGGLAFEAGAAWS